MDGQLGRIKERESIRRTMTIINCVFFYGGLILLGTLTNWKVAVAAWLIIEGVLWLIIVGSNVSKREY